jgi:hypothetical protein
MMIGCKEVFILPLTELQPDSEILDKLFWAIYKRPIAFEIDFSKISSVAISVKPTILIPIIQTHI